MDWLVSMLSDTGSALLLGVFGAAVFELVTVAFRFGLGWTAPNRTKPIARFTRGWRIHHGYPGVALLLIAPLLGWAPLENSVRPAAVTLAVGVCLFVGVTLALSDLVHHAVVLPILVRRHEFDLRYPTE